MRYVSTNQKSAPVSLKEAVNRCVADDGGMFMPAELPVLPRAYFNNIGDMSLREIAFVVANSFFGQDINPVALKAIVDDSFCNDIPVVRLGDDKYLLELFHGPTLTFKDYGARFMARLMRAIDTNSNCHRNVLVATTGNTGAAAANGLFRLEGISVSVLYPKGQLTRSQLAQLTALGENIHPLEIAGTVEDCKRLVQTAIADPSLDSYNLTGANSINIARLIPQITFALYGYSRLKALGVAGADSAIYSIPAGNMSNVVAAAMAKRMGCPMGRIIAATAANSQVAPLLRGEDRNTGRPLHTYAPSIDMSYPSGWPRLTLLYGGDTEAMQRDIIAPDGIDNDTIAVTINSLRSDHRYTIDPHGAVAYASAVTVASTAPKVIYATGHPAKQLDVMTRITGSSIEMPHQLNRFMSARRSSAIIPPTLPALKKHLLTINSH